MFFYLWSNRSRHPLFSKAFCKAWAKRLLTLPTLLRVIWQRWDLTRRGASLAPDCCVGEADIQGTIEKLKVGHASFIGQATISLHDELVIGSHVCINDDVTILTASHDIKDPDWKHIKRPVEIGDYAWVATGAMILPGVCIGQGAVIGAAAVVSKDVPPYAVATGNPAVLKLDRRSHDLRYSPVRFLAFQDAWLS